MVKLDVRHINVMSGDDCIAHVSVDSSNQDPQTDWFTMYVREKRVSRDDLRAIGRAIRVMLDEGETP
jgi:hypothetical protein